MSEAGEVVTEQARDGERVGEEATEERAGGRPILPVLWNWHLRMAPELGAAAQQRAWPVFPFRCWSHLQLLCRVGSGRNKEII